MTTCNHCGGQVFANMDDDLDPACFQCGRSNVPLLTIAELKAWKKPKKSATS